MVVVVEGEEVVVGTMVEVVMVAIIVASNKFTILEDTIMSFIVLWHGFLKNYIGSYGGSGSGYGGYGGGQGSGGGRRRRGGGGYSGGGVVVKVAGATSMATLSTLLKTIPTREKTNAVTCAMSRALGMPMKVFLTIVLQGSIPTIKERRDLKEEEKWSPLRPYLRD
eukprot:Gb_16781 [translate_table: standard]